MLAAAVAIDAVPAGHGTQNVLPAAAAAYDPAAQKAHRDLLAFVKRPAGHGVHCPAPATILSSAPGGHSKHAVAPPLAHVSTGQASQVVAPELFAKVAVGHGVHPSWLSLSTSRLAPAAHRVHCNAPIAPRVSDPDAQGVQTPEPVALAKLPESHGRHVDDDIAPTLAEYVPLGHAVQFVWPARAA